MNILRAITQAIGTLRETGRYTPEQLIEIQNVVASQFEQEHEPRGMQAMGSPIGLLAGETDGH